MSDNPFAIIEAVQRISITGGLVLMLFGFFKGWWVWGRDHDALKKDRDEWKAIAFSYSGIATKATELRRRQYDTPEGSP